MTIEEIKKCLKESHVGEFGKAGLSRKGDKEWLLYEVWPGILTSQAHYEVAIEKEGQLKFGFHIESGADKAKLKEWAEPICNNDNGLKLAGQRSVKGIDVKDVISCGEIEGKEELKRIVMEKFGLLSRYVATLQKEQVLENGGVKKRAGGGQKTKERCDGRGRNGVDKDGESGEVSELCKLFGKQPARCDENFFSDGLRYYLDPEASHGAGDRYLKSFIEYLKSVAGAHGNRDISNFMDYCLKDELLGVRVVREKGKVDVLIRNGEWAIIIENKVCGETDQYRQIPRYIEYVNQLGIKKYAVVYLKAFEENTLPCGFGFKPGDMMMVKGHLLSIAGYLPDDSDGRSLYFGWLKKCCESTYAADNGPLEKFSALFKQNCENRLKLPGIDELQKVVRKCNPVGGFCKGILWHKGTAAAVFLHDIAMGLSYIALDVRPNEISFNIRKGVRYPKTIDGKKVDGKSISFDDELRKIFSGDEFGIDKEGRRCKMMGYAGSTTADGMIKSAQVFMEQISNRMKSVEDVLVSAIKEQPENAGR